MNTSTTVTTIMIVVLAYEFGALLLSAYMRSLFGFFTTSAIFSGTVGAALLINAARDKASHFTFYKIVDGHATFRQTGTLFWANIDPTLIEVPLVVAMVLAIVASILFVFNHRPRDGKRKRPEAPKKPVADQTPKTPRKAPSKTVVPDATDTSSPSETKVPA